MCSLTLTHAHTFLFISVYMLHEILVLDQDFTTLDTAYTVQKGISSQGKGIKRSVEDK